MATVPDDALDAAGDSLLGFDEPSDDLAALVRRYIKLHVEKQAADAEARRIGSDKAALEEVLAERFGTEGVQNLKVDGFCVSRKRDTFCSLVAETKGQALEMLRAMGFDDMLTVNSNTLRSRVKEWLADGSMPPEFEPMVKLTESFGLAVRKS